jgi:tRNA-dihydrouridine synthase
MELLATSPEDRPLAIQIYGGSTDEMVAGAKWVENYGATIIDINMGCPVRKVVRGGGGSAMMCDTTGGTIDLVAKVVAAVKVPVTVKMRLGWVFRARIRTRRRRRGHDSRPNSGTRIQRIGELGWHSRGGRGC